MTVLNGDHNLLFRRLRDADEQALGELLREYEPEIRRVASVRIGPLLRPHLDSLDLVQSLFITLLKGIREEKYRLDEPHQLIALSAEIMRRKVAAIWRKISGRAKLNHRLPGIQEDEIHTVIRRTNDVDPQHAAELREGLNQALFVLDDVDRRLIELRMQGYTTSEAARAMGENPDVMRVRLSRLRHRLFARNLLADWL